MYNKIDALRDMKIEVENEILALEDQLENDYLDDFDRSIVESNLNRCNIRIGIILNEIQALSE